MYTLLCRYEVCGGTQDTSHCFLFLMTEEFLDEKEAISQDSESCRKNPQPW